MKSFNEVSYPLKEETFLLIGIAMEIHKELGRGFSEIVYKDAFELELITRKLHFEREREFKITYKGNVLRHTFFADFIVNGEIILELKAKNGILDEHYQQVLNYLKASKCKIGLLINFGEPSLVFRRLIH